MGQVYFGYPVFIDAEQEIALERGIQRTAEDLQQLDELLEVFLGEDVPEWSNRCVIPRTLPPGMISYSTVIERYWICAYDCYCGSGDNIQEINKLTVSDSDRASTKYEISSTSSTFILIFAPEEADGAVINC